ncbi:MAG: hypothetical protein DRG82_05900 [Deltaproteobacteria bacterium]|nr:MAG: hypothetical protein B1H13_08805 [Desulfobacteraceae bacterium 4484_190.3]RLB17660.1 MAG: hypothetical protein DRG82_05900 [Deltaproteobacteria bacterium]
MDSSIPSRIRVRDDDQAGIQFFQERMTGWPPAFTRVTTLYECIKVDSLQFRHRRGEPKIMAVRR